jgi:SAM-dependent methyltransferase
MQSVNRRDTCRLCGSGALELVLPILPSAIGDAFVPASRLNETQELYPLETYLCLDCGHLQNLDVVDPEVLFRDYTYRTSASLGLVEHFRKYAASVVERLGLTKDELVVEIGSNDGSLLKAFRQFGLRVIGVDPARAIAAAATGEGVPTIGEFFTRAIAKEIREEHGPASLVCANNVFAHVDDMTDLVAGIRHLLGPNGAFVFEVSYVPDIIDNLVFDTIYHEHVSHHSMLPLETFLNRFDMTLFDARRSPTKGGSIRGFAQPRSTATRARTSQLFDLFADERRRGIVQPEIYHAFFRTIEERKHATLEYLQNAFSEGKQIAAYGASTTTTTLLYHFEIGRFISYIVDDNPLKQGTYSPGLHLPVLPSSELYQRKPDIVVILAWTYVDPIIQRNQRFLAEGGQFLVPLPETRVIGT